MVGRAPYLCLQPSLVEKPIWGAHPSSSQGGARDWGCSCLQLQHSCDTSDKLSVSFPLALWEFLSLLLLVT